MSDPTNSKTGAAIEIRSLVKHFGAKVILRGVNLEVGRGESVAVIGASGTGKSVTVKCALALLRPDAGTVQIDGQDVAKLSQSQRNALMRRTGVLFQGGALFDSLPVWENVAFSLLHTGPMKRREARELAIEKLRQVGLDERTAGLDPANLSGGMRKRVAIARTVAADPEFLFFDEPTTGLDPITGAVIDNLILDCVQRLRATAITITHDLASARKIATRIALLHEGRIIWQGPSEQLDSSGSAHVEQFVHGLAEGPIDVAASAA